ncbi:MAG: hypothetical protein FH756_06000 [Firmicutes bacterium]|nr:hypothetical protein [Bacillota bacterium]
MHNMLLLEDILNYYKKELSNYNLVFKHIKYWFYIILILEALSGCVTLWLFFYKKFILLPATIVIFIALMYILNVKAKKVIEEKYNIPQKRFLWGDNQFFKFKVSKLEKYLNQNNITSQEQLKTIAELFRKRARERKIPNIILPGALISFFVPIWNQFLSWLYNNEVITFEDALLILLLFLLTIISIAIPLIQVRSTILDILNHNSNLMKGLADIMDELSFQKKLN